MRRAVALFAVALAVAFGGWKWDSAQAAPSKPRVGGGGDCVNGRYYYLVPGPNGTGEYYCWNGWLVGPL